MCERCEIKRKKEMPGFKLKSNNTKQTYPYRVGDIVILFDATKYSNTKSQEPRPKGLAIGDRIKLTEKSCMGIWYGIKMVNKGKYEANTGDEFELDNGINAHDFMSGWEVSMFKPFLE